VDGVDALLKCEIQKEQIKAQAQKLQDVHDIIQFCQQHACM
jgi:hypothetical protein